MFKIIDRWVAADYNNTTANLFEGLAEGLRFWDLELGFGIWD